MLTRRFDACELRSNVAVEIRSGHNLPGRNPVARLGCIQNHWGERIFGSLRRDMEMVAE
jgi:hypothetical protein